MAERSFKSEVAKLRLGDGQEFRGEGILAVTKALLQSGVSYVSGYQGAPISHLVDVLADADDVLRELGIRFEASANEAAAAAALAASINYPLRGAATFKSTWTAWLSQPSGHVTEMFADGKFGQLTAMLAVTAVVISARGAPGGEFEMSLHSRDVPSFCRVFAPA